MAIVLDQSADNKVEATSLAAPGMDFQTVTKERFAAKLEELSKAGTAIGTLFIISHGAVGAGIDQSEGVVFFEATKGSLTKVTLTDLAATVRAKLPSGMAAPPTKIVFRGCKIGSSSTTSLDAFRQSVGAGTAQGATCKTAITSTGAVSVGGKPIKKESDLPTAEHKRVFDEEFEVMVRDLHDGAGNPVRNCIVGLEVGELALANLDKLKKIYFRNGGNLAAVWTNPNGASIKDPHEPGCKCFHELKVGTGKCQLVEVPTATPPTPPSKPGKKTACVPAGGPVFTLASFSPVAAGSSEAAAADAPAAVSSDLVGLTRGDGLAVGTFDRRPRVERLQERLNERGATLGPDGMFGGQTADALHQLQGRLGVPEQDTVDPATAAALEGEPTPEGELSSIEGLRLQDGITFGTWHLRPRVSELQQRLTGHGFFAEPDGMFGELTLAALNAFQSSRELVATTVVDRPTADALEGRGDPAPCPPGELPVPDGDLVEV